MARHYDVVIIGGGVIGSAIAYFLTADPAFDGTVLVLEPDPSYETGATARSVGGIRHQHSTVENIRIGLFASAFLREAPRRLAVGDDVPDLSFREQGYLMLAGLGGAATLAEGYRLQRAEGAAVTWLDADGLRARFPWLSVEGLSAGVFGERGEGWIDPFSLLRAFRAKARAQGARYKAARCVGIETAAARVRAVLLDDGARTSTGQVVIAAGPRSGAVAALAGATLPVRPRKRAVYVFACRAGLSGAPLTVDPSGLYFRPEGDGFLCGRSPSREDDPDCEDFEVDHARFEDELWPLLAARVPAFETLKRTGGWAGHYDYNTLDQNAVLGPHPEISGLHVASGFSGHGLQQSPAVGRAVAELLVHGRFITLDLARFGWARVRENRPIVEAHVI